MITNLVLIFLLLLHLPRCNVLARVSFHKDGIWWVNYSDRYSTSRTRVVRWPWVKKWRFPS